MNKPIIYGTDLHIPKGDAPSCQPSRIPNYEHVSASMQRLDRLSGTTHLILRMK